MSKVILDPATLAKLRLVKDRVELCDESGRTVGYFSPTGDRSVYEQVKIPFTNEELDRMEREPGGRPLAEILAELERRG